MLYTDIGQDLIPGGDRKETFPGISIEQFPSFFFPSLGPSKYSLVSNAQKMAKFN